MNLLGKNFHFQQPFHKNLLSLKFSIGSFFTKTKAETKIQKNNFSLGFSQ